MDSSSLSRTHISLLEQVQCGDEAPWERFDKRYRPRIQAWCRRWQVPRDDCGEIAQIVFLKLVQKMRSFVYDRSGSFRSWLKTVTFRAWRDYADAHVPHKGLDTGKIEAGESLVQHLEEEFDLELLQGAMALVKERVKPKTWDAWRLLTLEEQSGHEVAARLDMTVAAAFMAKSRVQALIRDAVGSLESAMPGPKP
jgi:RNA polymerase sigma-70 factor (ECF subfamily)